MNTTVLNLCSKIGFVQKFYSRAEGKIRLILPILFDIHVQSSVFERNYIDSSIICCSVVYT